MNSRDLIQGWSKFWFDSQSPASICVFRICVGVLSLFCALLWIPEAKTYFGTHAIISDMVIQAHWGPRLGALEYVYSDQQVMLVLYGLIGSSICLTIGLWTPLAALATSFFLVSFVHRDPYIMNSGDTFLRLSALFLAFSPAWKMYSVDSVVLTKVFKWKLAQPVRAEIWVQRLFQLQLCLLYCVSTVAKLKGETWLDGSAVYYATRITEFQHLWIPFVLDNPIILRLLTWGALFIEFCMFTLVWVRDWRYKVLLGAIALHLGIDLTMNIPLFEWIMIAALINWVDGADTERFIESCKSFVIARFVPASRMAPAAAVAAELPTVEPQA
jgi:hypothetical protein